MPRTVRSRALVVFLLILVLPALPTLGQQESRAPGNRSPLASLWRALVEFIPGFANLGPGLDPLGGQPSGGGLGNQPPPSSAQGDLGPELDPLGR